MAAPASFLVCLPRINQNFWHKKTKVHAVLKSQCRAELWKHEVSSLSIRELVNALRMVPQWAGDAA